MQKATKASVETKTVRLEDLLLPERVASRGGVTSKKRAIELISELMATGQHGLSQSEIFTCLVERERLTRPGVILISDLDDDPGDLDAINGIINAYRRERFDLRVVALNAAPTDRQRFATLLANAKKLTDARLPGDRVETTGDGFPTTLVVLAALIALALAAGELYAARLTWRTAG